MDIKQINGGSFNVTEELARWRFELEIKASRDWWIAFSNPTAGPWKRLMGRSGDGSLGESAGLHDLQVELGNFQAQLLHLDA